MFTRAIVRKPGKNIAEGITTANLEQPDYDKAIDQFGAYIKTLKSFGLTVDVIESSPVYPDAHFVEDTAVVTPDIAVITNPGAAARNGEQLDIEPVLKKYRNIAHIKNPGTVDGGDVLMVGNHFFIGISDRTNEKGAQQLGNILSSYRNTWTTIPVDVGLHFKSSVNYVGKNTLLVTPDFADHPALASYEKIMVGSGEDYAGNTLLINNKLIVPKGFPETRKKLERLKLDIVELDMSEFRKMDGGLTCLSIRF